MAYYCWGITGDHVDVSDLGLPSRVGKFFVGGECERPDLAIELAKSEGRKFRLYDDDRNLNYSGIFYGTDYIEPEDEFEPLNWGMNDSGCTRIDYFNADNGAWETL